VIDLFILFCFLPDLNLPTIHFVIVDKPGYLSVKALSTRLELLRRERNFMFLSVWHADSRIRIFLLGLISIGAHISRFSFLSWIIKHYDGYLIVQSSAVERLFIVVRVIVYEQCFPLIARNPIKNILT
jgi:hypothetical protein